MLPCLPGFSFDKNVSTFTTRVSSAQSPRRHTYVAGITVCEAMNIAKYSLSVHSRGYNAQKLATGKDSYHSVCVLCVCVYFAARSNEISQKPSLHQDTRWSLLLIREGGHDRSQPLSVHVSPQGGAGNSFVARVRRPSMTDSKYRVSLEWDFKHCTT